MKRKILFNDSCCASGKVDCAFRTAVEEEKGQQGKFVCLHMDVNTHTGFVLILLSYLRTYEYSKIKFQTGDLTLVLQQPLLINSYLFTGDIGDK